MINRKQIHRACTFMTRAVRISTMLVCIHGRKEGALYGEILNCYMEYPVPFKNEGELILRIDEMCDWIGTPHPSTEPRFLNDAMEKEFMEQRKLKSNVPIKAKVRFQDSSSLVSYSVKARATLLITVEYRLHSSLQGRVQGKMTNGKAVGFRSAMELMRMMEAIVFP